MPLHHPPHDWPLLLASFLVGWCWGKPALPPVLPASACISHVPKHAPHSPPSPSLLPSISATGAFPIEPIYKRRLAHKLQRLLLVPLFPASSRFGLFVFLALLRPTPSHHRANAHTPCLTYQQRERATPSQVIFVFQSPFAMHLSVLMLPFHPGISRFVSARSLLLLAPALSCHRQGGCV